MIEKFESETDIASILGRTTLLAGTGFGLYQTFKETPSMPSATGYFRRNMARHAKSSKNFSTLNRSSEANTGIGSFIKGFDNLEFKSPRFNRFSISSIDDILTGGYKGRSAGLGTEIRGLYSDLSQIYGKGNVNIRKKGIDGGSNLIRIGAGGMNFDIPLVDTEGVMTLGESLDNRYAARSVLKDYDIQKGKVEVEGLDVALTKKYRENLERIKSGEISAYDIKRKATDKAIWENSKGKQDIAKTKASAISQIRKEQVVTDLLGERRPESINKIMKDITSIKGYGGGSAGMFAKGIFATPSSLISKGLPGAESTLSAYQLLRQSEFVGANKPGIDWMPGMKPGIASFNIATVNDTSALKRAAKKMGMSLGELAGEEAILQKGLDIGIKNKMYTFNIDLEQGQSKFTQRLMRDIYDEAEASGIDPKKISKAMTSSGGLEGINLDLNSKLQRLEAREAGLGREIDALSSWRESVKMKGGSTDELSKISRQIKGKKRGLESVRGAMKDYGILGYSKGIGAEVRVPGGDIKKNLIRNIKIRNNTLSIATESHFNFGVGSKLFTGGGGGKWTVKGEGDVPTLLAMMEQEKLTAAGAKAGSLDQLKELFKDVQMISTESPVKVKGGGLAPRETMAAVLSYAERISGEGTPEKIDRLKQIGITEGKFTGTNLSSKQLIDKIQSFHPGKNIEEIFGGEEFLFGKISKSVMAPDISSSQAGVGRTGTLSERAAYNMEAVGLGDFLEDIMGRKQERFSSYGQLKELEGARGLAGDATARSKSLESVIGDTGRLFQENISDRRSFLEGANKVNIDMGDRIPGVKKATVFASDVMTPYIGTKAGGGLSELDQATKSMMIGAMDNKLSETQRKTLGEKYNSALAQVEESVGKSLFKGKIKGSMYGQAVSALEGMDDAAIALGKDMGLADDMAAPLIAMSKSDIKRKFGAAAAKQAAEGNLWGLMTREPVEGVHSSLPVNIRAAEDFGTPGNMKGAIYVSGEDKSKNLIRRSMFVDFDKDTLNVIAATSEKSREAIEGFYGVGGKPQSPKGAEFLESIKRMSAFELKGRDPLNIQTLLNDELVAINAAQKGLEKGAIGSFSNEFKNIHIGLREQLRPQMGKGAAEAYYLGEDFSHLFVENILKAKHQSKESLVANSVTDALSLFKSEIGTEYAQMGKGDRAQALQGMFDELSFGSRETASAVRASESERVSMELAERMGFAKEMKEAQLIESAAERTAGIDEVVNRATKQRDAYKKITNTRNLENVLDAHELGRNIQGRGIYASKIAERNISFAKTASSLLEDVNTAASHFMTKGLKNVAKWGILPTMGIGLIASLTTKPKVLRPITEAGGVHEKEIEYNNAQGQVSAGKTLFSIPESKVSSFDIKGIANNNTNFEMLQSSAMQNKNGISLRLQDHRSSMDKYSIEEMIEKGY